MLFSYAKQRNTLMNQMVSTTFLQLFNSISAEHDSRFLASLYSYFSESLPIVGVPEALSQQIHESIIEATKRLLQSLAADKRKARAARDVSHAADFNRDEMALVEEMEDFALEDMEKMLAAFDPSHLLLVAVSGEEEG